MAEAKDEMTRNIEELEREITCGVCQELYQDPKLLPCSHCFCK